MAPAVEAWSLNHWTTKKPPCCFDSCSFVIFSEVLARGMVMPPVLFFIFRIDLTILGLWFPINFRIIYSNSATLLSLCVCVCSIAVMSDLFNPMDCSPPGSSTHGIFQATGKRECHFLLQGIFPTQQSNPHLQHLLCWQVDSLLLVPPRKPHFIRFTVLIVTMGYLSPSFYFQPAFIVFEAGFLQIEYSWIIPPFPPIS